jgi:hypothetical protein
MLDALKQSNEPEHLVLAATRYLKGLKGNLVQLKKQKAIKEHAAKEEAAAAAFQSYQQQQGQGFGGPQGFSSSQNFGGNQNFGGSHTLAGQQQNYGQKQYGQTPQPPGKGPGVYQTSGWMG